MGSKYRLLKTKFKEIENDVTDIFKKLVWNHKQRCGDCSARQQFLKKKQNYEYTEGVLKSLITERAGSELSKVRNGNYKKSFNEKIYWRRGNSISRRILENAVHGAAMYGNVS